MEASSVFVASGCGDGWPFNAHVPDLFPRVFIVISVIAFQIIDANKSDKQNRPFEPLRT
jgi:hypothetical protein